MAKYYGLIGYETTEETAPGVYEETIRERSYYGDVVTNFRGLQTLSTQLNDDVTINNQISIVADPFAYENFHAIRYATFMGSKWKISGIEVQYPRLILTLRGLYNGDTT